MSALPSDARELGRVALARPALDPALDRRHRHRDPLRSSGARGMWCGPRAGAAGRHTRSWPSASPGARSTPPSTGPGWTHSVSSLESDDPRQQHRRREARPRVQEGPPRRRRHRPLRRARRDLRLPRPERRRQVDDRPDADDAAAADGRHGAGRRLRRPQGRAEGALGDRRRAAGGGARPAPDGPRPPAAADDAAGDPAGRAQAAPERAARPRRADRGGRPQGRRLLGRHEAAPRSRPRARAPAQRSCSSTSRRPASTRRAARRSGRRSPASRARTT